MFLVNITRMNSDFFAHSVGSIGPPILLSSPCVYEFHANILTLFEGTRNIIDIF